MPEAVVARHRQSRRLPHRGWRSGRHDGYHLSSRRMFAALYLFFRRWLCSPVCSSTYRRIAAARRWSFALVHRAAASSLYSYIDMISDLSLLLSTLSIMTGALVITGVPTKLGSCCRCRARCRQRLMVRMPSSSPHSQPAWRRPDLYPGRHRDRPAFHPGRRQSVGRTFLRLLPRRLRSNYAADLASHRAITV